MGALNEYDISFYKKAYGVFVGVVHYVETDEEDDWEFFIVKHYTDDDVEEVMEGETKEERELARTKFGVWKYCWFV